MENNKMSNKSTANCIVFGCSNQRVSDPTLCEIHKEEAEKFRNRCDFMDTKQVRMIPPTVCVGCGHVFGQNKHMIRNSMCMNVSFGSCLDGRYNFHGATVCPNCGCGRNTDEILLCSCEHME